MRKTSMIPCGLAALLAATLLAGCASTEYRDNTAELARDPRCIDKPANPDLEPAPWCKPEAGTSWSSERKSDELDFSGKSGDD